MESIGICYKFKINEKVYNISLRHFNDNEYYEPEKNISIAIAPLSLNAMDYEVSIGLVNLKVELTTSAKKYFNYRNVLKEQDNSNVISTPMPGKVVKILVKEGDIVKEDDNIIIVEAMKMQSEYKATANKKVSKVLVGVGDAIDGNQPLVLLEDIDNN